MLMGYIIYKVFKIVKCTEKIMMIMMVCLVMHLVSKIIFYMYTGLKVGELVKYKFVITVFQIMPIFFLSVAIILNLRNWAFYNIRIGEMVYHS